MAALSQYYMHYANHLARLKHRRALSEQVEAMKEDRSGDPGWLYAGARGGDR